MNKILETCINKLKALIEQYPPVPINNMTDEGICCARDCIRGSLQSRVEILTENFEETDELYTDVQLADFCIEFVESLISVFMPEEEIEQTDFEKGYRSEADQFIHRVSLLRQWLKTVALGTNIKNEAMTDEEIRESIKQDIGASDEDIDEFCQSHNWVLSDYRNWLDLALAARRRDNPDYPNRKYDWSKILNSLDTSAE